MIKAAALAGARPFELPGKAAYLLALSFSSVVADELELEEGWLLVLGALPLVAPAPAEPLVVPDAEPLLLGLVDAPPPALFFSSGVVVAEPEAEPEAAPEGEDGVLEGDVVEPDEDAAPEGGVLVSRAVRPALLLSPQAARPKARETAAARMESFMCSPPWLG
jgi:hypothetical protein